MTQELKAGQWPPPQPTQDSSYTALFSRTRLTTLTNLTITRRFGQPYKTDQATRALFAEAWQASTEHFRTGYSALIERTQQELRDVISPDTQPTYSGSPTEQLTVVIASGNTIKEKAMMDLLSPHQVDIRRIPEAEESHSLNIVTDATSKALDAARIIQESEDDARRQIRQREHVTIANDQLNAVPVISRNEQTGLREVAFQRLGKPENLRHADGEAYTTAEQLGSVRETFRAMTELALQNGWEYIPYLTESATVIHNPNNPQSDAVSTQRSVIMLSVDAVRYLSTQEGFAEYVYRVGQQGFDLRRIAGGLEFQVMEDMGLVRYITGTPEDVSTQGFAPQREDAEEHAKKIALGHADERLIATYFGKQEEN